MATVYCYRCKTCGAALEREFPFGEAPASVKHVHLVPLSWDRADLVEEIKPCEGEAVRDYRAEGCRFNDFWFMAHMQSDAMPPAVKGAGRASKEWRRFAEETQGTDGQAQPLTPARIEETKRMLERQTGESRAAKTV